MEKITYTPMVVPSFEKPRNYPVMALVGGIALIGIAEGGRSLGGVAGFRLVGYAGNITALGGLVYTMTYVILRNALYCGVWIPPLAEPSAESWRAVGMKVTAVDIPIDNKTVIDVRLLEPLEKSIRSGKVHLFCFGNGMPYESMIPMEFAEYTQKGHAICLYNPPQYGRSTGVRTPASDFQAIEGVMEYLISKAEFSEESIRLEGLSLGSGPACWAASVYRVERLSLYVPIGKMEDVVERVICNTISWPIGRGVAAWLTTPLVQTYFNYDNVARIKESRAQELFIYEAEEDVMMTVGGESEAKKLIYASRLEKVGGGRDKGGHGIGPIFISLNLPELKPVAD